MHKQLIIQIKKSNNNFNSMQIQQVSINEESMLYNNLDFCPKGRTRLLIHQQATSDKSVKQKIYPIFYQNQLQTFGQIAKRYMKINQDPIDFKRLFFRLDNYIISMQYSILMLTKILHRQTLSETTINAIVRETQYYLETNIAVKIQNQTLCQKEQMIQKLSILLNNDEPIYLSLRKSSLNFKQYCSAITNDLNDRYKLDLKTEEIELYCLQNAACNQIEQKIKYSQGAKISQKNEQQLKESVIGIRIVKNIDHKRLILSDNTDENYLTFSLKKDLKFKLLFNNIKKLKVIDILAALKVDKPDEYGLKILNKIYLPNDMLETIETDMKKIGHFAKNLQAKLIKQKHIFYSKINSQIEQFQFDQVEIAQSSKYNDWRKQSAIRAKSGSFISNSHSIQLIMLYTSSLRLKGKNLEDQKDEILYLGLNKFLREQKFSLKLFSIKSNRWKYHYTKSFTARLQQLPFCSEVTYRGVRDMYFKHKVGQIVEFKQYLSSSLCLQKGQSFLRNQNGTFYTIKGKTGRQITQYSTYKTEREVIFLPYSQFKILEATDTNQNGVDRILMEEIETDSQPHNYSSIILWIDDKLRQGQKIFKELDVQMETTFMLQLHTTQQLRSWFQKQYQEFKEGVQSQLIKLSIITNMRRIQNGVEVKDAGAHTVKYILNELNLSKQQLFIYIGNIEGTKAALTKNNVDLSGLAISNLRSKVKLFLSEACRIRDQWGQNDLVYSGENGIVQQTKQSLLKQINLINPEKFSIQ